jgi:hypothetical protein
MPVQDTSFKSLILPAWLYLAFEEVSERTVSRPSSNSTGICKQNQIPSERHAVVTKSRNGFSSLDRLSYKQNIQGIYKLAFFFMA